MDWFRFGTRTAGLCLVLYVAAVLELSWQAGAIAPSWIALAVTLAVSVSAPSASVFWAAAGGFVIDATARGPIGPFLTVYGLIAGGFVAMIPASPRSWWFAPALAFALAAVQPVIPSVLLSIDGTSAIDLRMLLRASLMEGSTTALAATICAMLSAITQRLLSPARSEEPMQLSNRWKMLTE